MSKKKQSNEPPHWLERRSTVDGIVHALWVVCAVLVLAEFFYAAHPHFGFDGWFGFFAFFGFASYCCVVLGAKQLRKLIARPENYYHEGEDTHRFDHPAQHGDDRHD